MVPVTVPKSPSKVEMLEIVPSVVSPLSKLTDSRDAASFKSSRCKYSGCSLFSIPTFSNFEKGDIFWSHMASASEKCPSIKLVFMRKNSFSSSIEIRFKYNRRSMTIASATKDNPIMTHRIGPPLLMKSNMSTP